ncbi:MAG: cardiolipin synthase [Clostridia bacterium]|nr:cardiolipin synthase [Clostridia bacterium]
MKKKQTIKMHNKTVEREINYIPVRYIIAIMITVFEVLAIIGTVVALCYFVPYFYIAAWITQIVCVLRIISSPDNPDYKLPWLLFVLIIPIGGFMLYLIFYSRKLKKRFVSRLESLKAYDYSLDDTLELEELKKTDGGAYAQAKLLKATSGAHLFKSGDCTYYPLGENMMEDMLLDLKRAEKFIYMEYFIIEEGCFWNSILDILKEKATQGVEIKVLYDDIGCMSTLPGNYAKILKSYGIEASPFSRLKGGADSEFNNRSHRKITVIDGKVGYTGGVNIADEYINKVSRFGHWKDIGIRITGNSVWELTRLFITDFGINVKTPDFHKDLYPSLSCEDQGYIVPFGDGPRPLYNHRVSKMLIEAMIYEAKESIHLVTPYFIVGNEICAAIESAALRGVDVTLLVPHIPDKRLVFNMTRSYYQRLITSGVKIYEYTPGFVHAKLYLVDKKYAMIGTVNLDYRSLVHHFENGVWLYNSPVIEDMYKDVNNTLEKSQIITKDGVKTTLVSKILRVFTKIFSPML